MSQPPEWIELLATQLAARFIAVDVLSPLACHYCQVDDIWELTLFASRTEILGGPLDGGVRLSRFHLDLKSIFELFDSVESAYWQAHGMGRLDELGPHLGIEGVYQGHRVWVRLPALAPRSFPSGRQALVRLEAWEELW